MKGDFEKMGNQKKVPHFKKRVWKRIKNTAFERAPKQTTLRWVYAPKALPEPSDNISSEMIALLNNQSIPSIISIN